MADSAKAATPGTAPFPLRLISVPMLGAFLMRLRPPAPKQVDQLAAIAKVDFSTLPELRDLWVALKGDDDDADSRFQPGG